MKSIRRGHYHLVMARLVRIGVKLGPLVAFRHGPDKPGHDEVRTTSPLVHYFSAYAACTGHDAMEAITRESRQV
ncbi:MAG: hypothetical protein ACJ8AI_26415 [Rhodopila sp.]